MISLANQLLLSAVFLFSLLSKNLHADVLPWPWACRVPIAKSNINRNWSLRPARDNPSTNSATYGFNISISNYFGNQLVIDVIELGESGQEIAKGTAFFSSDETSVSVTMTKALEHSLLNYTLNIVTFGQSPNSSSCATNDITAIIKLSYLNGSLLIEDRYDLREGEPY